MYYLTCKYKREVNKLVFLQEQYGIKSKSVL